jgi:hypothetical protein
LLLVLRLNGYNDIEYNLGPVSALTGLSSGTVKTITGWDGQPVLDAFGDFYGAKFILFASSPYVFNANAVYVTDAISGDVPLCLTPSKLTQIWSKVSKIGNDGATASDSSLGYLSTPPTLSSAYSYIAANGLFQGVTPLDCGTWGGILSFSCEQEIAGSSDFYKITSSSATTKPAAQKIGTFAFSEAGELTFTAGAALPPVDAPALTVSVSGANVSISFTGQSGVSYQLRKSTDLSVAKSSWTAVGSSVSGTGETITLQDAYTSTTFYVVEAYR